MPGSERTGWKKKRDRRNESDRSEKRARESASGMLERDGTHNRKRDGERELQESKSRRSKERQGRHGTEGETERVRKATSLCGIPFSVIVIHAL